MRGGVSVWGTGRLWAIWHGCIFDWCIFDLRHYYVFGILEADASSWQNLRGSPDAIMPAAEPCPFVHAAFYLWYGTPAIDGRWLHWDHRTMPHWTAKMNEQFPPGVAHTPPDVAHSPYYPARGLYSSSDNATLLAQMRELAEAGVDSVMLSWWGQARNRVGGVATSPHVTATAPNAPSIP